MQDTQFKEGPPRILPHLKGKMKMVKESLRGQEVSYLNIPRNESKMELTHRNALMLANSTNPLSGFMSVAPSKLRQAER